jgi:hypothetical protein
MYALAYSMFILPPVYVFIVFALPLLARLN